MRARGRQDGLRTKSAIQASTRWAPLAVVRPRGTVTAFELGDRSLPPEPGGATFGTLPRSRLVTGKPSEPALARGRPQLSGERALTSAKTNAPPRGCAPGGTK